MDKELKFPEYFGKIPTEYAGRLLSKYQENLMKDDSLSGFLERLEYLSKQGKLFNPHGKLYQGKLPKKDEEDFKMLDVVPTLEGKLFCATMNTEVEIATKEDHAPGSGDDVVILRRAYDAVMNDVARMKKKMPGVELHYSFEERVVPCASYDGITIWNPDGEMIYDDDGIEFDEEDKNPERKK